MSPPCFVAVVVVVASVTDPSALPTPLFPLPDCCRCEEVAKEGEEEAGCALAVAAVASAAAAAAAAAAAEAALSAATAAAAVAEVVTAASPIRASVGVAMTEGGLAWLPKSSSRLEAPSSDRAVCVVWAKWSRARRCPSPTKLPQCWSRGVLWLLLVSLSLKGGGDDGGGGSTLQNASWSTQLPKPASHGETRDVGRQRRWRLCRLHFFC
mmetsp:Transcript_60526/g.118669  ORF Transcript_60526/g.118669 Transcript_60526/m.118669 type:complete len:210 (+) Transcript_60526:364-993(+)